MKLWPKITLICYLFLMISFLLPQNARTTEKSSALPSRSSNFPSAISFSNKANWDIITDTSIVNDLLLSDDGNTLWVATDGGLKVVDPATGAVQKIYTTLDGLPFNKVSSLLPDESGGIWIGTTGGGMMQLKTDGNVFYLNSSNALFPEMERGLIRLNPDGTYAYTGFTSDLRQNFDFVTSLISDGDGGIWIGTEELGIVHLFASGQLEIFNSHNSSMSPSHIFSDDTGIYYRPSHKISALALGNDGSLWAGHSYFDEADNLQGELLHQLSDGTWETAKITTSGIMDSGDDITSIVVDGDGGVYALLTYSGVAHLLENGTWEFMNTDGLAPGDGTNTAMWLDDDGDLWIASTQLSDNFEFMGTLMHLLPDGGCETFTPDNSSLPSSQINRLVSDRSGGMWIGTGDEWDDFDGALVHRFHDGSWKVVESGENRSSIPGNTVMSLIPDENGGVWVGTTNRTPRGGLAYHHGDGTWETFPISYVQAIASDGNDGIWAGSIYGLANIHSDGIIDQYTTQDGLKGEPSDLPDRIIYSLYLGDDKDLWVGTLNGGLGHRLSDATWEVYDSDNSSLLSNHVQSLISDGDSGIWVGTNDGGMAHLFSNGEWNIFHTGNSELPGNDIRSLISDGAGGIWGGTLVNGLFHLSVDNVWRQFNPDNSGFPDYTVWSLISDSDGALWAGTNNGIAWFTNNGNWEVFNRDNSGMPTYDTRALAMDDCGGMWVGAGGPFLSAGLAHATLVGTPQQVDSQSSEIELTWFLNAGPLEYHHLIYIELQRSLSKNGIYETVRDRDNTPIRYYADYANCQDPLTDNCHAAIKEHTFAEKGDGIYLTRGYMLNTPITDPDWLEGVPRYYRLAAVIEKEGELVMFANNQEAVLMTPPVEENPRVGLTLERSAIAVEPGTTNRISLFISSLDLFTGNIQLELASDSASTDQLDATLDVSSAFLNPGDTASTLLCFQTPSEGLLNGEQNITVISKPVSSTSTSTSGNQEKRTSLKILSSTEPMIAFSMAQTTTRPRVMDEITVTGNIVPAEAGHEVIVIKSNSNGNTNEQTRLITTEDGFFKGVVTATAAGQLQLMAQCGNISSNSEEIFILPARTHIALTSNVTQETCHGDILKIEGIITPVRLNETKVNLDIRYIDSDDSESAPKPQFVGGVIVDDTGRFFKEIAVPGNGFINVKASLPETSDFLGIETTLVIPIAQPVGEAIILVSESGTSEFQEISKTLGIYVYNTLMNRNIPAERIRYLGISHENGDNTTTIPVDGYADKTNLRHALTEWAVSLISTNDPYETPLNLYLIGNMEEEGFRLNHNEVLTSQELAQYLDEAESLMSSDGKGFPVTIVLEGAQSEQWIEQIAGDGRIVLTSSSDKPLDQGGFAGYDNLGESSFSRYFYQFINYGSDIECSFAEANYEILRFYRHTQRPVMDADGDGVGTTKYDRYEASGKFIEYRPSGDLRPKIRATNPDMTITGRENNTLWAIATDPEQEMKGVFCSITDSSDHTRHLELTAIDDSSNWYEIQLEDFSQTGCHQVVYYAKDNAGNVSLPVERFIHVTASGLHIDSDVVPQAPTLTLTMEGSQVSVSWRAVENAEGYILLYAPYPDATSIGSIDMGNQTSIPTFDAAGIAFYVAVQARNAHGESAFSNIEWFNLK